MHLGVRDRGPSGIPGEQDKRWRTHWVDSELEDEWLERLNSIPGIEIWSTCAGHHGQESDIRPGGPQVVVKTQDPHLVDRFAKILGKRPPSQEIKFDARRRKWILSTIPREPVFGIFPRAPYPYGFLQREGDDRIEIMALSHRDDMSNEDFRQWWELLIDVLEEAYVRERGQ